LIVCEVIIFFSILINEYLAEIKLGNECLAGTRQHKLPSGRSTGMPEINVRQILDSSTYKTQTQISFGMDTETKEAGIARQNKKENKGTVL